MPIPSSLIPTLFIPLSLLSYASLLGIVSTVLLIGAVFFDGLSKFDTPGSLWSPAETSLGFCNMGELGLAFGLFMAGVSIVLAFYNVVNDLNTCLLSSEPTPPSLL
jgi:vesicular inhibitory amino acid transporter